MVKIRLKRMGTTKRPFYRLVVADSRSPRDGRFIEAIGYYDPLPQPASVKIDADRVREWLRRGARPSDSARDLLVAQGILAGNPKRERGSVGLGAAPALAAAPEETVAVAEPVTAAATRRKPVAARPETAAAVDAESEPVAAEPEAVAVEPAASEPVAAEPEAVAVELAASEPVAAEPEAVEAAAEVETESVSEDE